MLVIDELQNAEIDLLLPLLRLSLLTWLLRIDSS